MNDYGIDSVRIILNPLYIDHRYFWHHACFDKTGRISFRFLQGTYVVEIGREYLFQPTMRKNIANVICELLMRGYLRFDGTGYLGDFVYGHLETFVLGLQGIDFFFDFIAPDKGVHECRDPLESGGDAFSLRVCGPDALCSLRNKSGQYFTDNQIPYEALPRNLYCLTFRLRRETCNYLHLGNLSGTEEEIVARYTPLLAIIYFTYYFNSIRVFHSSNAALNRLLDMAKSGRSRYGGGELLKTNTLNLGYYLKQLQADKRRNDAAAAGRQGAFQPQAASGFY